MAAKTSDWRPGPTVCRCCFADGCYKDISTEYFWMGKREVYSEMLSDTFDVSIAYAQTSGPNSNSRLICEPCISRLRDASDFKRQVQECEKVFLQHLAEPGSSMEYEILPETSQKEEVKLERVKIEAKLDDDDDDFDDQLGFDDDDDDDMDDEPLTKFASKIPKAESDDLINILQLGDDTKKPEKRKSSTKVKLTTVKKAKKKESPKPSASKAASKPVVEKKKKGPPKKIVPLFQVAYDRTLCRPLGTLFDFGKLKSARLKQSQKDFTPSRSVSPLNCDSPSIPPEHLNPTPTTLPTAMRIQKSKTKAPDVRQNVLTVFEFSTVYPFIYGNNKFKCFVCSQPFLETSLLRKHMSESHTFAPLKRLLNNKRENILKVDVSEIACKMCSYVPKDFMDLKRHLKGEHNKCIDPELQDNMIPFKIDGGKEAYDCVICQESFIKVRILVIHMSVHFNNYSCEICGSGFMTLRLLKKHLEVHENGNFPCDRCSKIFTTTHKRALHIRGVHLKQYPRRCPMCPERFNSNYRRTIHLQDVHNVSTRVHKCLQCGRAFNLKYHLICHTRSVHLQERNQACDLCHQRFCNKETLKRHMVIHTGEKNYKCEVCGMAFLRRKNLKDHLRLHDIV